jgi:hypothetical protein
MTFEVSMIAGVGPIFTVLVLLATLLFVRWLWNFL